MAALTARYGMETQTTSSSSCTYPKLTTIGFNGRKAYDLFRKHVMQQERSVWLDRLGRHPTVIKPAPGRYALPLDEKVVRWREFLLPACGLGYVFVRRDNLDSEIGLKDVDSGLVRDDTRRRRDADESLRRCRY